MKHLVPALTLLLPALIVSCTEGPTQADPLKGSLTLNVRLVDEYGDDLSNHSGVTVAIEGINRTATTDDEGYVTFDNLSAGTYVIDITRPGFSRERAFGYQFVGGGAAYIRDVYLAKLPTFTIGALTAEAEAGSGEDVLKLTGTISEAAPEHNRQMLRLYFHMSSTVSSEPGMFLVAGSVGILSPMTDFTVFYPLAALRAAGIAKGTRVYLVAHPMAQWGTSYFDPIKRDWIETNISSQHSQVLSFIMP